MALATALKPEEAREVVSLFASEYLLGSSGVNRVRLVRSGGEIRLRVSVNPGCKTDFPPSFSKYELPIEVETAEPGEVPADVFA
jgi:hypothetical protein